MRDSNGAGRFYKTKKGRKKLMRNTLKRLGIALMLLALALTAIGGAAFAEDTESHLNVAMFMWMDGLDPAIGWNGWTTMRCGIGETLLTANENMEVVPWLADSWEQLDDTTYSFHIRQGVKFSNGNDMTPRPSRPPSSAPLR